MTSCYSRRKGSEASQHGSIGENDSTLPPPRGVVSANTLIFPARQSLFWSLLKTRHMPSLYWL
ncbi:hypothetical protein RBSH_05357 [Rhodopirellula baltica SH28]|uniref:Uncharacterized protein n=1 Tax=Rhodopirellula baltica SH28 TaxID=993517 RepID=K5DA42_RHOBT|nr:hypothetical protein RBSH_05357 [Rhodopirellula baltica SH28]